MIETPRACLITGELVGLIDFISFGTNDLTQLTLGMSRDDSYQVLTHYKKEGLIKSDPF